MSETGVVACPLCGMDGVVLESEAAAFYELERATERTLLALGDLPTRVSHTLFVDTKEQYKAELQYLANIIEACHGALSASIAGIDPKRGDP